MKHREGARRVVSVFAAFLLATMGLTAVATAGPLSAAATETDPDKLAVEDVLVEDQAVEGAVAEDEAVEDSVVEDAVNEGSSGDDALVSEGPAPGSGAVASADPIASEESATADESYVIWVRYGDTAGGISDFGFDAQLGTSILGNLGAQEDLPSEGDVWMFGDGSYHRFLYWSFDGDMDKPLEASDFTASEQGGPASLEIHAVWSDILEPWNADGGLMPYTVNNGVMTFDGHPELGEWYQLTVDAEDGITFNNPGGSAAWTMTLDACVLDPSDPLYSPEANSGIYFVRGDGQGMSTTLWVDYDPAKALTYRFASGTGTISRVGSPNVLSINLSSPAVLSLGYSTETVIANEQGATLSHTSSGKTETDEWGGTWGDDATWSMLTLVTDPISGEAADKAEAALKDAIGVSDAYLLDIHLLDPNGNVFEIPEGDQVTVTLPIPESLSVENLHVFHVADDGTVTDMNATVDAEARTVSFTTTHFSTFALANVAGATTGDNVQPLNTADKASGKADSGLAQTGDVAGIAAVGAVLCAVGVAAFARKRMQH
mgnify:CR=1 FL=1